MYRSKNFYKFFLNFLFVFALFVVLANIFLSFSDDDSHLVRAGHLDRVFIKGQYSINDGAWASYDNFTQVPYYDKMLLRVRGHFSQDIAEGSIMMLSINKMRVVLKKNGEVILSYGAKERGERFSLSSGSSWESFEVPQIKTTDEVELELQTYYRDTLVTVFNDLLDNIYVGEEILLFLELSKYSFLNFIYNLLVIAIGIAMLVASMVARHFKISSDGNFLYFAIFIILAGICLSVNLSIISYFVPYPILTNLLYLLTGFYAVLFFCFYEYSLAKGKLKKFILVQNYVFFILINIALIIQLFKITDIYNFIQLWPGLIVFNAISVSIFVMYEKRHGYTQNVRFTYYLLPLVVGILCEAFNFYVDWIAPAILFKMGLLIFIIVASAQIIKFIAQKVVELQNIRKLENEVLQSKIVVMLSEIQPHFIFNALNAISGLCLSNPKKASEALINFSDYLRSNLDSLQSEATIDFNRELGHIKHYVKIEQMRFGDKIKVIYDINFADFKVPSLTIQPLVENAIKHGISHKKEGGTVILKTEKIGEFILITIKDDGVGLKEAEDKGIKHHSVGLENVSTRLKFQVEGELAIKSEKGKGVLVTVRLPLKFQGETDENL